MTTVGAEDDVPAGAAMRLRATVALLALLLVVLGFAGRSTHWWPLATWPVYYDTRPARPSGLTSLLEVRAHESDGTVHVLRTEDLVEPSRHEIADFALARSVERVEDRAYLRRLVDIAVDGAVQRIELWEVTWRLDPLDLPPLDLDHPLSERRVLVLRGDPADVAR